ncbi:chemotaxis protein CheC [uncultured Tyzzerella sp.]|uniref:chemotaxis protein CheC n=1 Tax=uncultured Tyzzerella sp. TaxID=2321398 RepID=UPI002942EF08|nr:chemotaxis protein CheC [uncultured Tyzzerella sp.]
MSNLNLMDIDMLKEVANIGTGNAATSLSNLVNQRISMTVPTVKMPEFKNLADIIGGADALIAGLLVGISGDVDGIMMYLMTEKSACTLAKEIMGRDKNNFTEFDEIDYSMLTEIGNILTSSYLTALSQLMNYKINQSVPSLSVDMAGAILSVPAIEFGRVADRVLFIESTFSQDSEDSTDLTGFFMLIPEVK